MKINEIRSKKYEKHKWLAECSEMNVIYCFQCILAENKNKYWCKVGVLNIDPLTKTLERHEKSYDHINSCFKFLNLGKINLHDIFFVNRSDNFIKLSNIQSRNIQYTLTIIRSIIFLGKQGISFRGDDES